jgi:hypothetical protein
LGCFWADKLKIFDDSFESARTLVPVLMTSAAPQFLADLVILTDNDGNPVSSAATLAGFPQFSAELCFLLLPIQ